ncbi:hypothetical protein HPTD01_2735 [Halomonas sp. TD01]|nr:hypothetical protein HPTD01_2735 [Halomonas sp. TD01]
MNVQYSVVTQFNLLIIKRLEVGDLKQGLGLWSCWGGKHSLAVSSQRFF